MGETPTASQTVGPFFSIGLDALCRENLAREGDAANRVSVRGCVLDGDGQPVPDAILEIWQGGSAPGTSPGDAAFDSDGFPLGFGRVATNERGEFQFTVSRHEAAPELDGKIQAAHVVVLVFMRGLLRHLVTRMYFSDEAANSADPVLCLVPAERRKTIIAKPAPEGAGRVWWDIHLQGEQETVFFEA